MRNSHNDNGKKDNDEDALSHASTASDSSATARLKWRNHESLSTPLPETREKNPFEDYGESPSSGVVESSGSSASTGCNSTQHKDDREAKVKRRKSKNKNGRSRETDNRRSSSRRGNVAHRHHAPKRDTIEGDKEGRGMAENRNDEIREAESLEGKIGFRGRIRHFTWTWFTMTMATGGIANVLYTVPFRFSGLYAIGCLFFIFNIVLFLFNITMISLRFYYYPRTFRASFLHPTESLFIPAAVISFGTILINISQYGVVHSRVWLQHVMQVMYWIDCGLAVLFSIGIYLIMWSTQTFTISQMTPVWIFPAYPLLIIGPHASNLSPKITSPTTALCIIVSGFVIQGIGFLVSLMIYSAFLYRLMTQKLPKESIRPGMFISVGPSGFTIAGVIGMGQQLPNVVPRDFMGEGLGELAGNVSMICANWVGLWLWGLALWWFFVSVGAHWSCARKGRLDFAMTWYSFVFPNTGLTTATFAVARALGDNRPIQYVGCAMTVLLVVVWVAVFAMMIRAVVKRQILWPQKQEDRDEGGWKGEKEEVVYSRRTVSDAENGLRIIRTLSRRSRRARRADGKGRVRDDLGE
ncbi:uncharacterized protein EI97DRAFT_439229 [Westerdykella ornata]|uniref:C4-dicarboxylate/malic acid transporter n=1 Tax=Westerdykella ornata TaxID=318751 RepID=A0A6A6JWH4_WESOR|nr:uncharacterized protein EI97DRAFT_439229 [Westerdykella ornata]KAF2280168.1 hypothetical protein EI97DRAFT_439229 [Westerdykella ornata]